MVAYLAASVHTKHAETGVKYPVLTDPPDYTEILQIIETLQIVQTASPLTFTDHADPADHTHPTR